MAPIFELADRSTPPKPAEFRVAAARLKAEFSNKFNGELRRFMTLGETPFDREAKDIRNAVIALVKELEKMAEFAQLSPDEMQKELRVKALPRCRKVTLNVIDTMPIEWTPQLLESQTPLTVYLKLCDAIGTATTRVHYLDRYLNVDFHPLYLRHIDRSIEIRLVTTAGNNNYGVANVRAESRLAQAEFASYQLIQVNAADMHDRNLRIDDTIFYLGPSVSHAGNHPTNFSPADSSPSAHAILDGIIAHGSVVT
jgi:hypothetical protein